MAAKYVVSEYRVEVGVAEPWISSGSGDPTKIQKHMESWRRNAEDVAKQIKRHCDEVTSAHVQSDGGYECEHCGAEWTEGEKSTHNGGCCDEDCPAFYAANGMDENGEEIPNLTSEWLDSFFPVVPGRGWVVTNHLSIFNTRTGFKLFAGPQGGNDSHDSFPLAALQTESQVSRLADGLGIVMRRQQKAVSPS